MKSNYLIPIILGIFLSIFMTGQLFAGGHKEGIEVGNKAPDFEIETLSGEKVNLSDYKGKPVMLNFWATWCPPCRVEIPDMQKFHEKHEVEVLAVNLLDTEMKKGHVQQFVDEFGMTFTVGLDGDGAVSNKYRINPIPTTYMIDSEGIIRHKSLGAMPYDTMVEHLNSMN